MPYRFVRDLSLPNHQPTTIYADAERRVWLLTFSRPHPVFQTEEFVELEYGFDTTVGQEIGRLVFGNPVVISAATNADAR